MLYAIELEPGNQALPRSREMLMNRMGEISNDFIDETARVFRLFCEGDDAAFSRLYEMHNQKMYSYCTKIVKDYSAAQDITHTVWEKVIGMRNESQKVENPSGFLFRIARNLCFDYNRHHTFQTSLGELPEREHPTISEKNLSEEEEMVIEALDELRLETKEILILHYYSGYTFEEIAVMVGKTPNAIWTRVSRARNELKKNIMKKLRRNMQ